jgi:membrane bound O-acyltransferase family protein
MTTLACPSSTQIRWPLVAWLPLAALPAVATFLTMGLPAWLQMWLLAISIYGGFKWLTFATSPAARRATVPKAIGYLFFWTGMDAEAFFGKPDGTVRTRWSEWTWAVGQTTTGIWILLRLAPRLAAKHPLVAAWLGMTGVVSILHFGASQILSLCWRAAGVNARHIMHKPLLATSLADFWGRRWNLAFRDLMHRFVLRPLLPNVGGGWAMMSVFFVSGLIHDAVISLAARGGFGMPTLYFLIQGVAVLCERSRVGKAAGLGRGFVGWLFAAAVIVGPAGLLFHPPFITLVVLPMLFALTGGAP